MNRIIALTLDIKGLAGPWQAVSGSTDEFAECALNPASTHLHGELTR